jgi:peptidoglycan/xylan/chitin deacetylase (PgdA/CDA1 family)
MRPRRVRARFLPADYVGNETSRMNFNPVSVIRNELARRRRAYRRRRLPHSLVLMYHRIAPHNGDPLRLVISPENFAEQLAVLSRIAQVMPLAELDCAPMPRYGELPRVAITFDDGYVDNLIYAEPLLAQYKSFGTVFVATSLIGEKSFWWDELAAIILGPHPVPARLAMRDGLTELQLESGSDRRRLFDALHSRLKAMRHSDQVAALDSLRKCIDGQIAIDPLARPMTEDELLRLKESKYMEIGAHTRSHPSLPNLSRSAQMEEIAGSKQACEKMLGFTPESFAYPYGDYSPETRALVAEAGFKRAYSTYPDLNFSGTDAYLIPRFGCNNWNGIDFERHIRRVCLP